MKTILNPRHQIGLGDWNKLWKWLPKTLDKTFDDSMSTLVSRDGNTVQGNWLGKLEFSVIEFASDGAGQPLTIPLSMLSKWQWRLYHSACHQAHFCWYPIVFHGIIIWTVRQWNNDVHMDTLWFRQRTICAKSLCFCCQILCLRSQITMKVSYNATNGAVCDHCPPGVWKLWCANHDFYLVTSECSLYLEKSHIGMSWEKRFRIIFLWMCSSSMWK